ncbi:MAG: M23 family metallopeptidase [Thermodesulfobacteriota bacterium]
MGIALAILCVLAAVQLQGASLVDLCRQWNELQVQVRDGKIPKEKAMGKVVELHSKLIGVLGTLEMSKKRAFPVEGGSWRDLGGKAKSGFVAKGYDFYHGNRHGGHPAHDIFIPDRDRNCRSDASGNPVAVRAFASGVVVGINTGWEPGSDIRGGNYVWVLNPGSELYCYYAHLDEVHVRLGQLLEAGQRLGTVGRSGKNAYPPRSPTHLHFMCLSFDGGRMTPYDTHRELLSLGRAP